MRPKLRIVQPHPEERYVTCVPLVPLKAAAGAFSDHQHVEDDNWEWVAVDSKRRLRPGMFVAQVAGKSVEPTISDSSYCLFRAPVIGTRQGKIVLVQLRNAIDPDNGERYTVKRYQSEKVTDGDSWRHTRITLKPINPDFQPIEITGSEEGELQVVAELVEVLGGTS
jgi:SOS-response transcriptional repressor LexA